MSEVKRVFNYKKIIMLAVFMCINLFLFMYINVPKSANGQSEREINRYNKYIESYHDEIDSVIKNADYLQKFSIFNKGKTFTYSNILRTANDFRRIQNVEVSYDNSRAVESFVNYYYSYYIAFFFVLIIVYDLFKYRENGVWQITFCTRNGRDYISAANIVVVIAAAVLSVVVMALSTFVCSLVLYGGVGELGNPIQNIYSFGKFTYPISKLQYVILLIAANSLLIAALGLIIWAVFVMFRQRNYAVVCIAVFIGLESFLYKNIEYNSILNGLHYINVVSVLHLNEVLRTYINWGFKEYVFHVSSVVTFSILVVSVIAAITAYEKCGVMRPYGKVSLWSRIAGAVNRMYQRMLSRMPQLMKEIHKLVFSGHGVWYIAVVLFVAIYFSGNGYMTYTDTEILKDEMYLEHGGKDKEYIREYTNEKLTDLKNAMAALNELIAEKDSGNVSDDWEDRYYDANGEYQYARVRAGYVQEFADKLEYLDGVKEQYGVDAWLISERGYAEIIGSNSVVRETIILITLVAVIMLMAQENIELEYTTGVEYILNSSVNGRKSRKIKKYISLIIFALVLCAVTYGIEYYCMYHRYGMPYMQAPSLSLQVISDKLGKGIYSLPAVKKLVISMSVGGFIAFKTVIYILCVCIAANAGLLMSYLTKGKINRAFNIAVIVLMIVVFGYIRIKLL